MYLSSKFFDGEGKLNHYGGHIRLARDTRQKGEVTPSSFGDGGIGDGLILNCSGS